jgi:glycosyltransferase involved in cell wall biosynthesis
MSSSSEGLPVVCVQALAHGLAVVASRIGGFNDLVSHEENGYLIDVDDEQRFKECLETLLSNPARLLGFRRSSLSKAHAFGIDKVASEYETLLKEVIRGS